MSAFEKETGFEIERIMDLGDKRFSEETDGAHLPCMGIYDRLFLRDRDAEFILIKLGSDLVMPFALDGELVELYDDEAALVEGITEPALELIGREPELIAAKRSFEDHIRKLLPPDGDVELVDVQLAPAALWEFHDKPQFEAILGTIGDSLARTEHVIIPLDQPDADVRQKVAAVLAEAKGLRDLLMSLHQRGASCTIDELAVRALELEGFTVGLGVTTADTPHAQIRMNDRLTLVWRKGRITARYRSGSLSIDGSTVIFHNVVMGTHWRPVGSAVTSLREHPLLTDAMRLTTHPLDSFGNCFVTVSQAVFFATHDGELLGEAETTTGKAAVARILRIVENDG